MIKGVHLKRAYFVIVTTLSLMFLLGLAGTFLTKNSPPLPTPQPKTTSTPAASVVNPEKYLIAEAALLGVADNVSYYFKDLASNQLSSLEPARSWIPASTIKAFVAVEAFRQNHLGLISFDQSVTIRTQNVVPTELETDDYPRLREGATATVHQLVEAMVVQSDNTAYNTLLDILDRRSINNSLRDLGLTETVVGQKLNLDNSQEAVDQTVPGYQPNSTTAKDYATLFDLLYSRQIPSSQEILAIFKRQKINNMIPAFLPQGISVAHKTGDWDPIFHDGGIVYKPDDPFILAIFTNSGKPEVLANLARVAYFRNANSVGVASPPAKSPSAATYPRIILAMEPEKILGEATAPAQTDKFPSITAADLGITQEDLTIDRQDSLKIRPALVVPGSPLYIYKLGFAVVQSLFALTPDQKSRFSLDQSVSRLSEAKTMLANRKLEEARFLLNESEQLLSQAVTLSEKSNNNQGLLTKAKQVSDLQFVILAKSSDSIAENQKEMFVDTIYNLYKAEQKDVLPAVHASTISNPTSQKPAIAVVEKARNNILTVKFDSGATKEVIASDLTPIRQFHSPILQSANDIKDGEKIAIIGQTNANGQVIPQFILRNLPAQLPTKIQGTVLEINPQANSLTILDSSGHKDIIHVTDTTLIRSTGTSVSLPGIRAGSQLTVFPAEPPPPAESKVPADKKTPDNAKNAKNKAEEINAVTITVTKNGSGKSEKVTPKAQPPKEKPAPDKDSSPQKTDKK